MKSDEILSKELPNLLDAVLENIKEVLAKSGLEERRVVTLSIANPIASGQIQYISNGTRKDMAQVYRLLLAHWEEEGIEGIDTPYHKQEKKVEHPVDVLLEVVAIPPELERE